MLTADPNKFNKEMKLKHIPGGLGRGGPFIVFRTAFPCSHNGSVITTTWSWHPGSSPLYPGHPSLLVLQLIGQPVQALVEAVPAGGAGGLDVPVAVA